MTAFAVSVLEQAPTRTGTTAAQSIRDVRGLARAVDELGYHRLWIAEHHTIGGVASSAPEVLIGEVASITTGLRIGSGGILLPNHRPLHVAEVFLTLEALHPGRIDLGVGRSEGTLDETVLVALGRPSNSTHETGYGEQLDELLAFAGVKPLPASHPLAAVRASPLDGAFPPVFMLGSSVGSAAAAAARGLGYGFAAYSNTQAVTEALHLYRQRFAPSKSRERPHAILGLRVMVGEDDDHASALALPFQLSHARARSGHPGPLVSVEEAQRHRWTAAESEAAAKIDLRADVTGGPERVRARLEELVAATGADEVIVTTNTFDPQERLASLRRLAEVLALPARRAQAMPSSVASRETAHRRP